MSIAEHVCASTKAARSAIIAYLLNLAVYQVSFHRPPGSSEAFAIQRMLVMLLCPLTSSYSSMYYLITYIARITAGELSFKQVLRSISRVELPKTFQDAVSAGAVGILIPTRFHEIAISYYWYQAEFGTIALKLDLEELDKNSIIRSSVFTLKTQHRVRGRSAKQSLYPSSNMLTQLVACVQLVYSAWTYLQQYKTTLVPDGISSPFISLLPYMLMSFINLVTNMVIPIYSNIYVLTPANCGNMENTWSNLEQHEDFMIGAPRPVGSDPPSLENSDAISAAATASGGTIELNEIPIVAQPGVQEPSVGSEHAIAPQQSQPNAGTHTTRALPSEQPLQPVEPVGTEHSVVDQNSTTILPIASDQVPAVTATGFNTGVEQGGLRQRAGVPQITFEYEPEGDEVKEDAQEFYAWLSAAYPDIDFENATFTLIRRRFHPYFWTIASFVQENDVLFLIPVVLGMLLVALPRKSYNYWSAEQSWVLLWMFGGAVIEAADDLIMAYSATMRRWRRRLRERTTITWRRFDTNLPGMFKRLMQIIFFAGGLTITLKTVHARGCVLD